MSATKKAESAAQTRASLEKVARELFEERGFDAVSAEEIVAAAGVTRGALYHHYDGKEGLFEAVVEAAMARLHRHIGSSAAGARDPLEALSLGIARFLELATAPRLQRVLFVDAPAVLGWQRWRKMDERYGLGLLKGAVEQAMKLGLLRRGSAELVAHIVMSGLIESAMVIAQAEDKAAARREAEEIMGRVLAALR
jgi:AcrR family transcriptional regulator